MNRNTTLALSLFALLLILAPTDAFSQEEKVTVDTLISYDDNGNKRIKIISKKMKGGEGNNSLELHELLNDDVGKSGVFFFGDDDRKARFELKGLSDNEFDFKIDIESLMDGSMNLHNSDENIFFLDGHEGFSGDVEVMKMESESKKLARQIRNEDNSSEKDRMEGELETLLTDIFDRKQENMESRLQKKSERLDEEKAELAERKSNRSKMLEDRKAELLRSKSKKLRW